MKNITQHIKIFNIKIETGDNISNEHKDGFLNIQSCIQFDKENITHQ
ncbi:MAG: hypothetical protein MAG458_01395 [Nitrosopumilus sp.]|nr:hypothetical protein [Nitrosopumilus sp.]